MIALLTFVSVIVPPACMIAGLRWFCYAENRPRTRSSLKELDRLYSIWLNTAIVLHIGGWCAALALGRHKYRLSDWVVAILGIIMLVVIVGSAILFVVGSRHADRKLDIYTPIARPRNADMERRLRQFVMDKGNAAYVQSELTKFFAKTEFWAEYTPSDIALFSNPEEQDIAVDVLLANRGAIRQDIELVGYPERPTRAVAFESHAPHLPNITMAAREEFLLLLRNAVNQHGWRLRLVHVQNKTEPKSSRYAWEGDSAAVPRENEITQIVEG